MPRTFPPLAPALRRALRFSVVLQLGILFLSATVLDGGHTARICQVAAAGFGAFLLAVVIRRSASPTRTDLLLIRAGHLPAILITAAAAHRILLLRGL